MLSVVAGGSTERKPMFGVLKLLAGKGKATKLGVLLAGTGTLGHIVTDGSINAENIVGVINACSNVLISFGTIIIAFGFGWKAGYDGA